jgi:hypothetical protein
MIGPSRNGSEERGITPYRQNTDPGPRVGHHAMCELCENERRCFSRHGLVACRDCHHDLLPGSSVF